MKTIKLFKRLMHSMIIASLLTIQLGCEKMNVESPMEMEMEVVDTLEVQSSAYYEVSSFPYQDLSQDEIRGLMFMREEEKLARDTYIIFYDLFGLLDFNNIAKSEQAHMDAILYLLDKYNQEDPANGTDIGVFRNQDLQQLFDDLQEMGQPDRNSALKVGALIEETDILDIQHELDHSVDNEDVRFVYENLIRGSKNHLKSFVRVLRLNGIEYAPELLDEEVYQEIINN